MGNLIGSKLPGFDEDHEPTDAELRQNLIDTKEWLGLLYAETIDTIETDMTFGEADVVVVTDDNSIVLDFKLVRWSVDDQPVFADDDPEDFNDYVRQIIDWTRTVPGMRRWTVFHIHPEGMSQPSGADEKKVSLFNALDLVKTGHIGGPRCFSGFVVTQRSSIVALNTDQINGITPQIDALTARVFANSYDRVLGVSHPLSEAMNAIATATEEFAAKDAERSGDDGGNPITRLLEMMEFVMGTLGKLNAELAEARQNLDLSSEEFKERAKADYEAWVAEGKGTVDRPAPAAAPVEQLGTGELPELPAGILADLAGFNFDSLDAQ